MSWSSCMIAQKMRQIEMQAGHSFTLAGYVRKNLKAPYSLQQTGQSGLRFSFCLLSAVSPIPYHHAAEHPLDVLYGGRI